MMHRHARLTAPLATTKSKELGSGEAKTVSGMRQKETLKQACFQGYPESAECVQIPVGSRNSASHNAYHTSLRPSSLFKPRHPSLKVVRKQSSVGAKAHREETQTLKDEVVKKDARQTGVTAIARCSPGRPGDYARSKLSLTSTISHF